jgi:NAD kinase
VKIQPVEKNKSMCVILDGHLSRSLNHGDVVCCENTDRKVRIVRIDPPNFYTTVTTKLFDRGNSAREQKN